MINFDEWMNKNHSGAFDMPHQRDCYEAGAQSKQSEIDELRKRIDKVVHILTYTNHASTPLCNELRDILKGTTNEQ